jgi:hypothetical protein
MRKRRSHLEFVEHASHMPGETAEAVRQLISARWRTISFRLGEDRRLLHGLRDPERGDEQHDREQERDAPAPTAERRLRRSACRE